VEEREPPLDERPAIEFPEMDYPGRRRRASTGEPVHHANTNPGAAITRRISTPQHDGL